MPSLDSPSLRRSGLDRQVGFLLREASLAVWADLRRTLAAAGLKPQSYATLLLVEADAGCKQQDIADALGVQRPNLVALIDDLVARNWIARTVNADDRRSYALSLTSAGRDALACGRAVHSEHEARVDAALEGFDAEALRAATARLARL